MTKEKEEYFITARSMVSMKTLEPLVEIELAGEQTQMGLSEAREHAMAILEAAEAAESDAFVFRWLTRDIIGTKDDEQDNFRAIIEEFRAFREARTRRAEK